MSLKQWFCLFSLGVLSTHALGQETNKEEVSLIQMSSKLVSKLDQRAESVSKQFNNRTNKYLGAIERDERKIVAKLDIPRKETPLHRTKLTPLFQVPFLVDQVLLPSWFG